MFSDPVKNLRALGLREENIVADLGAGTGFYSVPAGRMVARGKVYAVEINKDFLTTIKHKIHDAHLSNVEILLGDVSKIGGTHIGDGIVDAVVASNVLFQVADQDAFVKEVKRILKVTGKVLLVDWSSSQIIRGMKVVSKNKAREYFEKEGFVLDREINTGEHHYGMIFIKK